MTKKHYSVTAKFGHVGRNNYIIKTIPVKAFDAKEAAEKARWTGRVKHHDKNAILEVKEISENEFEQLMEAKRNDNYFNCCSIQEQRLYCDDIYSDVIREEFDDDSFDRVDKRRARFNRNVKRNKAIVRDYNLIARTYCNSFYSTATV